MDLLSFRHLDRWTNVFVALAPLLLSIQSLMGHGALLGLAIWVSLGTATLVVVIERMTTLWARVGSIALGLGCAVMVSQEPLFVAVIVPISVVCLGAGLNKWTYALLGLTAGAMRDILTANPLDALGFKLLVVAVVFGSVSAHQRLKESVPQGGSEEEGMSLQP